MDLNLDDNYHLAYRANTTLLQ